MSLLAGLTPQILAVLWLGAFVGAIAAGGAGFAFALAASAIWLHALSPLHTTMLAVVCATLIHTTLVWPMRRQIDWGRLWPFALGGVIGVPIGVTALAHADLGAIKLAIGAFLLVYGLYALAAPRLPALHHGGRMADGTVGLLGGVLGGLAGYSGVLPTIWTQLRGWPKETARGVYQPFILIANVVTIALLGFVAVDAFGLLLLALALPPLALGTWLGWRLYGRLDDKAFRRMMGAVLAASGATLLF